MPANIGTLDRIARLLIGVGLIVAALAGTFSSFMTPELKYGAIAVGVVLAATSAFRFCPLYKLIGVNTCRSTIG